MKDVTWLRDYFTDTEIQEYKDNILARYFGKYTREEKDLYYLVVKYSVTKDECGEGKTEGSVSRRKRRTGSKTSKSNPSSRVRQQKAKK